MANQRQRTHGYTLIELMTIVSIIAILAALALGGVGGCIAIFGPTRAEVEADARAWAANLGIQADGVSCVLRDTDGDGYISCSINSGGKVIPVECAYGWGLFANTGCRTPKLQLKGQ